LKIRITLLAVLALVFLPVISSAQMDTRAPGIYALVGEQSIPLTFVRGSSCVSGENYLGVEISKSIFRYGGETSDVVADSTFVLVIDPKQKEAIKKMKEYDPFIKSMKPTKLRIVPLTVNKELKCREFYPGMKAETIRIEEQETIKFDWQKLCDNSFVIQTHRIPSGEYGIIFSPQDLLGPDYSIIFSFSVHNSSTTD